MKSWKYILTAALLPASLWAANVSGIVGAPAPSTVISGAKIVLYSGSLASGTKIDSTTSAGDGTYSFTTSPTSGARTVLATKAGYHQASNQATATATAQTGVNLSITIDDSSSVLIGRVLHASDSTPAIGATVTLTGGKLDAPKIVTTDSTGAYRFDKASMGIGVPTATGYNISIAAAGYTSGSVGNVAVGWNTTINAGSTYLTRNLGTVKGTVRRGDSTTIIIRGAKMVFSINGLKVDSTVSDSIGNFTLVLNAATYTMKSSAAGYRGNQGTVTRDTTVTINFGTTTFSNVYLHPASGTIYGTITHSANVALGIVAGNVDSAKVYLERRMGTGANFNTWTMIDSTRSDAGGFYQFTGLIPATGGATPPATGTTSIVPAGNYRTQVKAKGYTPNYDTTAILTSVTSATALTLAYPANSTTQANVVLAVPTAIYFPGTKAVGEARISVVGDRLVMDFGTASKVARTVEVFDIQGSLQHSVVLPVGQSKVTMPAMFAKGFLFQVK